jgi:hypothetical protein
LRVNELTPVASKRTYPGPLLTVEDFGLKELAGKIRRGRLAACGLALICGVGLCTAAAQATASGGTAAASSPQSQTSGQSHSAARAHPSRTNSHHRSKRRPLRGQQKIDTERALEIQQALIREHYLAGKPSGTWNQASEDAMRKYQADHGWQSKTVPDSRALISLGLGPSHDHLLNPESAMTTGPDLPHGKASAAHGTPTADPAPLPASPALVPAKGQADPPAASPPTQDDATKPQ